MTVADIEQFFEHWAPRWTAWERDNVGLQVGNRSQKIRRILVCLDVTPPVVQEAIRKNVDLIVSHHPLLFRPPSSITGSDAVGRLVLALAEKKIALFSAHTNLDHAQDGVSFSLARALGLQNPRFLTPLKESLTKVAVFVPEGHVEAVTEAMARAGAGIIGNYASCSFRLKGAGTFRGNEQTRPFVGQPQRLEVVDEIRLEMIVPRAKVNEVIEALKAVHPYEEVAYDVYSLENVNPNYGKGAIGELPRATSLQAFLKQTKRALGAQSVRYVGDLGQRISRVAVVGGSGSELLHDAIAAGADAFLTADVRYHTFHEATGRIALVDAGHWETEHIVLPTIERKLRSLMRDRRAPVQVSRSRSTSNPTNCL